MCPACLLRAAMAADSPNQPGLPDPAAAEDHGFPSIAERLGARIDRYKLLEQVGEGGSAVYYGIVIKTANPGGRNTNFAEFLQPRPRIPYE